MKLKKQRLFQLSKKKIKLLESSYNTKALQSGTASTATLIYDYAFDFNMKAPDFEARFADGWEPVSLLSNNNGICGCFRKLKLATSTEPSESPESDLEGTGTNN